jgi:TonB-dependent starch-binding outer membrane protein SusC
MRTHHAGDVVPEKCRNRWTRTFAGLAAALSLCTACAGRRGAPAPPATSDTVQVGRAPAERSRASDAVGSVSPDELETMRVAHVEELIRGRMPGVEVERDGSGELTIRIRGAGTLGRGSGEPLLVLDGIPMNGRRISRVLDGLVPSDIARIDVLKDAGATAPYGILGANGVILITTKRAP